MITVNDKLDQIEQEWSTEKAILPSGEIGLSARSLNVYIPKLVAALRALGADEGVSREKYDEVAHILGADPL